MILHYPSTLIKVLMKVPLPFYSFEGSAHFSQNQALTVLPMTYLSIIIFDNANCHLFFLLRAVHFIKTIVTFEMTIIEEIYFMFVSFFH